MSEGERLLTFAVAPPAMTAPDFAMMRTEKPWGHELLLTFGEQSAMKLLVVESGHRLSLQLHRRKREWLYVVEGKVSVEYGHPLLHQVLTEGMAMFIEAGTVHRVGAGQLRAVILEVSTPELDDVERLEDDYGRAGDARSEPPAPAEPLPRDTVRGV